MTHSVQSVLIKSRLYAATLAMVTTVCCGMPAMGQYSAGMGTTSGFPATQNSSAVTGLNESVPSGPATNELLHLTLRDAGTAPRIDLTRTEVQLHTEEYNLSVSRNNFDIAKLDLSRTIGLPLGQEFDLADQLPYSDINPPSVDDALKLAYRSRSDLRAALSSEKAADQTLSAAKGERFPVIAANGGYGDVGPTFGQSHGDFTFQAGVNVPIFTGGRIKGDIAQAEAQLRQRRAEAENIRGGIDYDVRAAFLNLNAAKEQIEVAKQNVSLANESLARSKDRFTSGVTDSVEVVQAEQALASANDQYISSLYNHSLAKLSLARALGVARTNYEQYLGGK